MIGDALFGGKIKVATMQEHDGVLLKIIPIIFLLQKRSIYLTIE